MTLRILWYCQWCTELKTQASFSKLKCLLTLVNRTCKTGFVLIDGRCYKIYSQARLNWKNAQLNCSHDHGDLAKVNITAQREGLSALLKTLNLNIATKRLYLGLSKDAWTWMDGSAIDSFLWKSGYPRRDEKTETCVVLDGYKWEIKNVPCFRDNMTGFICQSREGKKLRDLAFHTYDTSPIKLSVQH